jgi:hypothetical protein
MGKVDIEIYEGVCCGYGWANDSQLSYWQENQSPVPSVVCRNVFVIIPRPITCLQLKGTGRG